MCREGENGMDRGAWMKHTMSVDNIFLKRVNFKGPLILLFLRNFSALTIDTHSMRDIVNDGE